MSRFAAACKLRSRSFGPRQPPMRTRHCGMPMAKRAPRARVV